MAFAKRINEELKMDEDQIILGAVAPDVCAIERNKELSHFGDAYEKADYVKFLIKYKKNLNNPFVMGYLTHIYLDQYFYNEFMAKYYKIVSGTSYTNHNTIYRDKRTGNLVEFKDIYNENGIYRDYSIINSQLRKEYDLREKYNISLIVNPIKEIDNKKISKMLAKIKQYVGQELDGELTCFNYEELKEFLEVKKKEFLKLLKTL